MVIDFHKLNEKTIDDVYPMPNTNDILDQLGGAKYFSMLDLANGFHQIPMDPTDAQKTAFSTLHGHCGGRACRTAWQPRAPFPARRMTARPPLELNRDF